MKDIENRDDVVRMVDSFYDKVKESDFLSPVFNMTEEEWAKHLPRMYNFWDNWLFATGSYNGGMMWVHIEVNQKHKLAVEHFEHWLALFIGTVDSQFAGKNADFVKNKAIEIGQIMNAKIQHINQQRN